MTKTEFDYDLIYENARKRKRLRERVEELEKRVDELERKGTVRWLILRTSIPGTWPSLPGSFF